MKRSKQEIDEYIKDLESALATLPESRIAVALGTFVCALQWARGDSDAELDKMREAIRHGRP